MMKRVFSMLLVMAMLLSFLPAVALAAEVVEKLEVTIPNLQPGAAVPESPGVFVQQGGTLLECASGCTIAAVTE